MKTLHLTPYIGLLLALIAAGVLSVLAKGSRSRGGALSHPWPVEARRADANKSHALKSAGVPLIRWTARNLPDAAAIRAAVLLGPLAHQEPR